MTIIDKRVVEMGFDNQQFEKGVQTSVQSLGNLKKGLDLSGAANSLSGIADGVQNMAGKMSAMGVVGFTVLQNLTTMLMDLGEKAFKAAIGFDQMQAGFGSYEVKIGAVKTVMSGTGETIDQVTKSLDALNNYSDRTIYSFQDMTENISKFTNAGLSSKDAATAIMGISNVAAISGANTSDAARAMYNFGQAMQQGSVRLMDWKSIENANMATIGFKQQLLDTAVALGTVKKQADGTYKTLSGGEVVTATNNFNGSLEKQWLTTAVLTKTLADYASTETDIGKKANSAAQDVKTFSQLMATIQDSVKTGWTKSWQVVFGDLNQSTALFTEVNNIIGGITGASATARNELLTDWAKAGGRLLLIDTLRKGWEDLLAITAPIKKAFEEIFPPTTGWALAILTSKLHDFVESLKPTAAQGLKIFEIFRGVFSIFDIGIYTVQEIIKWLGSLVRSSGVTADTFLDFGAKVGEFFASIQAVLRKGEGFSFYFDKLSAKITEISPVFASFLSSIGPAFSKFIDWINLAKKCIEEFGFFGALRWSVMLGDFGITLDKVLTKLEEFVGGAQPFVGKIKGIFASIFPKKETIKVGGVEEAMLNFTKSMDITATKLTPLQKLFEGVGKVFEWFGKVFEKLSPVFSKIGEVIGKGLGDLGSVILKGLDNIDYNTLFNGLNTGMLAALVLAFKGFLDKGSSSISGVTGVLDTVKGSLKAWQDNLKSSTLIKIAGAVAILAVSLIGLSMVDPGKLLIALGAISGIFAEVTTAMNNMPKKGLGVGDSSSSLLEIAAGLLLMSFAIEKLANIDGKKMMLGILGIGLVLAELMLFMKLTDKTAGVKGGGLLILAIALNVIAIAVEKLGNLDQKKLQQGLIAIGAVLAELALFVNLTGNAKNVVATGAGLLIISASMLIFADAIAKFGNMSWDVIARGLTAMGLALAEVVLAMNLLPKDTIGKSVGLLIIAGALDIIGKALVSMGKMSWEELAKGLIALAASLLIIVIALNAMNGSLPGAAAMIIMAGALAILAPVLKLLGSMSLAEIGLSLLALAGAFTVIGLAGLILGPLTPVILALSGAMVLFGVALLAVGLGVQLFSIGLAALAVSGAAGAVAIGVLVTTLFGLVPMIAMKLAEGLVTFVQTIVAAAPSLQTAFVELVRSLISGIVILVPEIVTAGFTIITNLLKGISDNIETITTTVGEIIVKFLGALALEMPKIVLAGADLLISLINGLTEAITTKSKLIVDAGLKLCEAIIKAVVDAIKNGAERVFQALKGIVDGAIAALWAAITGKKATPNEVEGASALGEQFGEAFALGIAGSQGTIEETTLSTLNEAMANIADSFNSNIDVTPTIRPVIDLTDVLSGTEKIDKLFGQIPTLNVSASVNKLPSITTGQSGSTMEGLINQPSQGSPSVVFNQNNYSPSSISRIDIYRQTRNQLLMLKGLVPDK